MHWKTRTTESGRYNFHNQSAHRAWIGHLSGLNQNRDGWPQQPRNHTVPTLSLYRNHIGRFLPSIGLMQDTCWACIRKPTYEALIITFLSSIGPMQGTCWACIRIILVTLTAPKIHRKPTLGPTVGTLPVFSVPEEGHDFCENWEHHDYSGHYCCTSNARPCQQWYDLVYYPNSRLFNYYRQCNSQFVHYRLLWVLSHETRTLERDTGNIFDWIKMKT